jgi:hypothetical protein
MMDNPTGGDERISPVELTETWPILSLPERLEAFALIDRSAATEFFVNLDAASQAELLLGTPPEERRLWLRLLEPDDAADVLQAVPEEERQGLVALLDEATRKEVGALLAYAEDDAGGLMSPRYARLRPDLTVDEAIVYLRRQARERLETIYYVYVLGADQKLLAWSRSASSSPLPRGRPFETSCARSESARAKIPIRKSSRACSANTASWRFPFSTPTPRVLPPPSWRRWSTSPG